MQYATTEWFALQTYLYLEYLEREKNRVHRAPLKQTTKVTIDTVMTNLHVYFVPFILVFIRSIIRVGYNFDDVSTLHSSHKRPNR